MDCNESLLHPITEYLKAKEGRGEQITTKDFAILQQMFSQSWLNTLRDRDDYVEKKYMSRDIGVRAYQNVLSDMSVKDAFVDAVTYYGETLEYLDETKNRKWFYGKDAIQASESHPQQQLMLGNGTLDKSSLRKTETPNQQMRKLHKQKSVSDELESLKEKTDILKKEVDTTKDEVETVRNELRDTQCELQEVKASSVDNEISIRLLQDVVDHSTMPKKDRAYQMIDQGCTLASVAKQLDVNVRTIKRWKKERDDG